MRMTNKSAKLATATSAAAPTVLCFVVLVKRLALCNVRQYRMFSTCDISLSLMPTNGHVRPEARLPAVILAVESSGRAGWPLPANSTAG